jgi:hypothetical protein
MLTWQGNSSRDSTQKKAIGVLDGAVTIDSEEEDGVTRGDQDGTEERHASDRSDQTLPSSSVDGKLSVTTPLPSDGLHHPQICYICKAPFVSLHFFYDQLCPSCADVNYRKRKQVEVFCRRLTPP